MRACVCACMCVLCVCVVYMCACACVRVPVLYKVVRLRIVPPIHHVCAISYSTIVLYSRDDHGWWAGYTKN